MPEKRGFSGGFGGRATSGGRRRVREDAGKTSAAVAAGDVVSHLPQLVDQQRWFPDFVPIADFVHAVEYVHTAAKALHSDAAPRWRQYLAWVNACWQGRVDDVIAELHRWQAQLGPLPEGAEIPDNDARKIVPATARYLTNNRSRMDYPGYRRRGLPVTSSLAESLVKQVSQRVKGTEKFWNDGPSGEAILQVRALVISDGDRLQNWIRNRHVSPFLPRCRRVLQANSA